MGETKEYRLRAVLSVLGDKLLCPMAELFDIIEWLTGDKESTIVIPTVRKECRPWLLRWFPELAEIDLNLADSRNWQEHGPGWELKYGKTLVLPQIPKGGKGHPPE